MGADPAPQPIASRVVPPDPSITSAIGRHHTLESAVADGLLERDQAYAPPDRLIHARETGAVIAEHHECELRPEREEVLPHETRGDGIATRETL